ncbi:hypothetical protein BV25DRAFT_1913965 [Artomyces pyxidatus]|uniref:Uncharacterized protein n=1 Tax=Artomyces pyxidatus TaxID=48021 RepID=A0ACB8T8I6_9AGAM|nr:hypothetical protein BV25DRAFT_1913965 [Artomyces pyxidatus]
MPAGKGLPDRSKVPSLVSSRSQASSGQNSLPPRLNRTQSMDASMERKIHTAYLDPAIVSVGKRSVAPFSGSAAAVQTPQNQSLDLSNDFVRHLPMKSDTKSGIATVAPQNKPGVARSREMQMEKSGNVKSAAPISKIPSFVPPKRPEIEHMTIPVMDPIRVTFGPGFQVQKIVTGFESLWITLANIPVDTNRDSLHRLLAPFGTVLQVTFRNESRTDATTTIVSAQLSSYPETVAAIEALDDAEVFGTRIRVRSSMGKSAVNRRLQDKDVRISWAVPSKVGYAGFSTLQAAQKAVAAADGSTMRDHWVTATIYDGLPVVGTYNVRFQGLPPDAQPSHLSRFGRPEGTMLERPTYSAQRLGVPAVQALLAAFGPMDYFDVSPPPYKDGMVRAWARFDSPDVAKVVCELHGIKQRALGGTKLYVHRVHSVMNPIARELYSVIESEVLRLQAAIWNYARGSYLRIFDAKSNSGDVNIKLVAEDSKILAKMKAELSLIVQGELVVESPSSPAWDDYFSRAVGEEFLNDVRKNNPTVLIRSDKLRRTIRILGNAEKRKPAAAAIVSKLLHLRGQRVRTIPLVGRLVGLFMSSDLLALQRKHGVETVWLDFERRILCVRGDEPLYEEVQHIVHRIQRRHPDERNGGHCPVCFEPPTTPVTLYCGHTWCKACFSDYLRAASDNRSFPLKCLGDSATCTECIPLHIARNVLPSSDFDALTLGSFHTYVHARPDEFHYCPTPDCPQVYRAGPRDTVLNCPSCLTRLCPHCHVEYHEGVTCADRTHGDDQLFDHYVNTHDVKKCPGCHALIERAEGCNHMTCTRCKTHTCWVCLETFEQGKGIYDHMRSMHGDIGL